MEKKNYDGCQISNMHEACEAYRNGLKWAGQCGGITYAHFRKSAHLEYDAPDSAGNNFWELYREISFRAIGSEPFNLNTATVDEENLAGVTAEDMLTIAACIKHVANK